ncbi:MAG: hypothetical protein JHC95_09265 [Solirubrobacteraceae bacterium]|nr:hypothetical protein [Solirubrobacteraceae bacterium]
MAQTRKRRTSKHRGNAAGMVEARGRTGRKPTEDERKSAEGGKSRGDRFAQPPTWKGAFQRALIAAALFAVLMLVFFKQVSPVQMIPLLAFMLFVYVPLGYYTDLWIYNRRQKKLQGG